MLTLNVSIKKDQKTEYQNGATRTTLVIVNKTGEDIEANKPYPYEVGYLAKGNHRFFFININRARHASEDRYLFADGGYGVDVKKGTCIKQDSSVGGYGNSESTVTLVEGDSILYCHSYKDRQTGEYYRCADKHITRLSPEEATIDLYGLEVEVL